MTDLRNSADVADTSSSAAGIDARDPDFRERPHERLDDLRARNPVLHDRELDRVVLTRADDIAPTLADRTMSADPFKARPTAYSRRALTKADRGLITMVHMDGLAHARLRGLVTSAFSARAVETLRPRIERIAADLLDGVEPEQPFDLVSAYVSPLPTLVIAAMLGVDDAQVGQFKEWSDASVLFLSPTRSDDEQERLIAGLAGLNACLEQAVADRRRALRDDLISALVAADVHGDRLTDAEIVNNCRLLLVAGNITTTDLMGNGVVALLRHPEQLARLQTEPDHWPAAVEEMLRYDPPVVAWDRQTLADRQVNGCPVEAGQTVTSMLLAANHDPALHADPHAFEIGRTSQRHFSFGGGAHFCLGASLARLEAQVGLSKLFDRFPRLRLAPGRDLRRKVLPGFNGYEAVWVEAA